MTQKSFVIFRTYGLSLNYVLGTFIIVVDTKRDF